MTGAVNRNLSSSSFALISEAQLARIFDGALGAVVSIIDRDRRLLYANQRFADSFKVTPDQLLGKTLDEIYAPEHVAGFLPFILRALSGESVTYDRLGQVADSTGVWHTVAVVPWRNEAGEIIGVAHSAMRVHELKVAMEALRVANQKLSLHMDNSPLAMIELDGALNILKCSKQIESMLGHESEALIGRSLAEVIGQRPALQPVFDALDDLRSGAQTRCQLEATLTHREGTTLHSEWFCSALTNADHSISSILCLIDDITPRVVAQTQLREQATRDALTGLLNRRAFYERLGQAATRSARSKAALTLLFIDLDGFKTVNDRFGHEAGDDVLREVARRLTQICRASDEVGRLGGDEFVVLAEADASRTTIEALSDRIARALHFSLPFAGGNAIIGVSIGIASQAVQENAPESLVRIADLAMYAAKHAGKGCVRFAEAA